MKFNYLKNIAVLLLTAAVLTASFAPASGQSIISRKQKLEKAKEYFTRGQGFIRSGNFTAANLEFAKAELMLQEAAVASAENAPASVDKETAAAGKQARKDAAHYLDEIKKETSSPDYYYNLGIDYLRQGQFVQAGESFKLALNLDPQDSDSCYNLGVLYDNYLGDNGKALKYYQQYLQIKPDAADARQVKSWISAIKEETGEK